MLAFTSKIYPSEDERSLVEMKCTGAMRISSLSVSKDFPLIYIPLHFLPSSPPQKTHGYKAISKKPG